MVDSRALVEEQSLVTLCLGCLLSCHQTMGVCHEFICEKPWIRTDGLLVDNEVESLG